MCMKRRIPKFKWHVPPFAIHVLIWIFIYILPILFIPGESEHAVKLRRDANVIFAVTIMTFYANYSFFIPKFLFTKRIAIYVLINIIMFSFLTYSSAALGFGIDRNPWWIRSIMGMILINGVAISARSTDAWFNSKDEMQKLELENMQSELSLLKMQISPHFLFNTLNNILTLIDENKELAKKSVLQLSKLLRFILYDSQADTITIKQETEFLINYSNLMRLRYGEDLNFKLETSLEEPEAPIAPLLLIPLLENIFKHGISASVKDSFINIKISSDKKKIVFESSNTYFPKTSQDKSGSGIGMVNVQKRLDLLYEKYYSYDSKISGDKYITKLELQYDALS